MSSVPADPLTEFLSHKTFAVVGASNDRAKYGNTVFRDLVRKGFTVYPVNPREETIEETPAFADLAALPQKPDGVVLVVPPPVTEKIVEQVIGLGIKRVWMQQGSESPAAIAKCEENGISVIHGVCVMMQPLP